MAMDATMEPEKHPFMSPVVKLSKFKETALAARDRAREIMGLEPLRRFEYPVDVPPPPAYIDKNRPPDAPRRMPRQTSTVVSKLSEVFGMGEEQAQQIMKKMSMEREAGLNNRGVLFRRNIVHEDIPANTKLETLKIKKKVLENFKDVKKRPLNLYDPDKSEDRLKRREVSRLMYREGTVLKYNDLFSDEFRRCRLEDVDTAAVKDIVVTIVINKPRNTPREIGEHNTKITPYWKYRLRGDTALIDVHALFCCSADFGATMEEDEEIPKEHELTMMKYPSSFLFIHDTFYVVTDYIGMGESIKQFDMSKLEPIEDISEEVREFMASKKVFGKTYVKPVQDFKVIDLEFRLGYPYVYVHQGNCEHVFFFTDLRLADQYDYPIDFPQKISDTSLENRCIACHKRVANWIVEMSETMPVTTAHMCDECYVDYHFLCIVKIKEPLKVYPYMDPSSIQP